MKVVILNALSREMDAARETLREAIVKAPDKLLEREMLAEFRGFYKETPQPEDAAPKVLASIQTAYDYFKQVEREYRLARSGNEESE